MQLVVLVTVDTAPPWQVRMVRVIVLVIWFSRTYVDVVISVVVGVRFVPICTIRHAGYYGYCCYCYIVEVFDVSLVYVMTNS